MRENGLGFFRNLIYLFPDRFSVLRISQVLSAVYYAASCIKDLRCSLARFWIDDGLLTLQADPCPTFPFIFTILFTSTSLSSFPRQ
uniref:Uncharacterized protein n=1 Tax=Candidatus Kentrum sp. TUN TaxID=2126343 RepID=A0A451A3G1_9GAMM|nr:MAG: hypothetical protein BECKTUN1418F_GA0071002_11153 [Candidatus Kentron sp. TUN]VFK60542.1 MAG: hypothetical protein BECKTUN1418D_GA0071000_11274 [Candidatus Kentron sp. TUN]VFK65764.1 MAG: hypothetical protein BECKTUN1418E_GA0071001_11133 [Candidatus Kentron sp. TUN]